MNRTETYRYPFKDAPFPALTQFALLASLYIAYNTAQEKGIR